MRGATVWLVTLGEIASGHDTGVLIAVLITSDTPPDRIYQAWRKRAFDLVNSEWQLAESRRVSRYARLRQYLKPAQAGALVNGLRDQAIVVDP